MVETVGDLRSVTEEQMSMLKIPLGLQNKIKDLLGKKPQNDTKNVNVEINLDEKSVILDNV